MGNLEAWERDVVTVRDFRSTHGKPMQFFLPTFTGFARVGFIRGFEAGDPWAVCPELNGGFGLSFMVCPETELYSGDLLVKTFGSMEDASRVCKQSGGAVSRADDGAFRMRDYMTGKVVSVEAEGGDAVLPQYGARVRVTNASAYQATATGGSLVGVVTRVQSKGGEYSFEVRLEGSSGRRVWAAAQELEVLRKAPASDLENYKGGPKT